MLRQSTRPYSIWNLSHGGEFGDDTSGKSPTIEMISFVMRMLEGMPLSQMRKSMVVDAVGVGERVQLVTFFMGALEKLYKVETTIRKDVDFIEVDRKFIIEQEVLYKKET